MQNSEADNNLVLSYRALRRLIGILGFALPILIVFYRFVLSGCGAFESSISAYYHTGMRDVFVGIICGLGLFMITYKGYEPKDTRASRIGGIFAICVAMFPTSTLAVCGSDTSASPFIGGLHFAAAIGLFSTFAYMSYFLFTISTAQTKSPEKIKRNRIYRVCGIVIMSCIALIALSKALNLPDINALKPTFWLEAISLFAFGTSWLVKGEVVLKDKKAPESERPLSMNIEPLTA